MLCEWCGKEFNSISKRFCSKSCRAKFAASKVKKHVCNFPKHKNSKTNNLNSCKTNSKANNN